MKNRTHTSNSCVVTHEQYLPGRLEVYLGPTAGEIVCADLQTSLDHRHTSLCVSSALGHKQLKQVHDSAQHCMLQCKSSHCPSCSSLTNQHIAVCCIVVQVVLCIWLWVSLRRLQCHLPVPSKSRIYQQASPSAQLL